MKLIYLLFTSLIALSNCMMFVNKNTKTILSGNYFYLTGSSYSSGSNLFLDFEDKSYYLNYNNLQVCITDKEPYDGMSCYWSIKQPAYRVRINSDTDLTYYFNYKSSDGKYIVVKFDRTSGYSGGYLYVRASNEDTHNIAALAAAALGIVAIVLIVIGSIIVLGVVITILICCCICRRRTVGGQVGYVQPTYVVTNPNPVTYPLAPSGY